MKDEKTVIPVVKDGQVVDFSDGYHTFGELYEHRNALWIALAKRLIDGDYYAWRSKVHDDGTSFEGWFVLGVFCVESDEQMSYHLPEKEWEKCSFARTLDRSLPFDGHTSADVLQRIRAL